MLTGLKVALKDLFFDGKSEVSSAESKRLLACHCCQTLTRVPAGMKLLVTQTGRRGQFRPGTS